MAAEAGIPSAARTDRSSRVPWPGLIVTSGGAALIGVAAFLPWLRTGHVDRTSFQMMRTAQLLDVVSGLAAAALRLWYLVPMLVAAVWLTAALDRPRLMSGLAVALALAVVAVDVVVLATGLPTGPGPKLALLAAATTLVGVGLTVRATRRPT